MKPFILSIIFLPLTAGAQLPPLPTNSPPSSTMFTNIGVPPFESGYWARFKTQYLLPPDWTTTIGAITNGVAIALFGDSVAPSSVAITITNRATTARYWRITWCAQTKSGNSNPANRIDMVEYFYYSDVVGPVAQPAISITSRTWVCSGDLALVPPKTGVQYRWTSYGGASSLAGIQFQELRDPVPAGKQRVQIDLAGRVSAPTGFTLEYSTNVSRGTWTRTGLVMTNLPAQNVQKVFWRAAQ